MKRIARSILAGLALVLATGALAQEIGFTATVDRTTIAAGEHVRLTISLTNAQERFSTPDLGGLVVVQGPFENSSFNYVNGRMSSSVSRTWTLTATQAGRYTIGAARVKVGNGVIETDPITIEVTKATARPPDPAIAQGQRGDPNLFITISLSKPKAYVGEQVIASYYLYSRYNSVELSKFELPKLNGFWSEEVDIGDRGWENDLKVVNGIPYKVALLKQQLLFPQRSGKLRIEPMELKCVVNRSFFNQGSTVEARSNATEFTSLELPPGAPADFNGAVGELTLEVKADRTQVKADEAIEISVRIAGRSNLKLIEPPKPAFPTDFESYDPKVADQITVNGGGMSGAREFQYTVIPRHEGRYDLEPIGFSYFDTRTSSYKTLRGKDLTIDVAPGDGAAGPSLQRPMKSDVVATGQDIRYIRTGDLGLKPARHRLFGSAAWWAGMGAPALAFVLFVGWRRRRERLLGDAQAMRRRKAQKVAHQRLHEAREAMKRNDRSRFFAAASSALRGYLCDRFGLGLAELNASTLAPKLAHAPDGAELTEKCISLLAACDLARFAPVGDQPSKEFYDQATALIERIEQTARA